MALQKPNSEKFTKNEQKDFIKKAGIISLASFLLSNCEKMDLVRDKFLIVDGIKF